MAMAWQEPERGELIPGVTGRPMEAFPSAPIDGMLPLPEERRRAAKRRSESPPGIAAARERLTIRLRTGLTSEIREMSDERGAGSRNNHSNDPVDEKEDRQRVVKLKVKVPKPRGSSDLDRGRQKLPEEPRRRSVRAGRASFTPPESPLEVEYDSDEYQASPIPAKKGEVSSPSMGSTGSVRVTLRSSQSPDSVTKNIDPKEKRDHKRRRTRSNDFNDKVSSGKSSAKHSEQEDDSDVDSRPTNDWCSACGGTGRILCCDNCPKSYHFTCADPPVDQYNLPSSWLCRSCEHARGQDPPTIPGIFSALAKALDKRTPLNFQLPKSLREHFERVGTDEHGDFIDLPPPKVADQTAPGTSIELCYRCQGPAVEPLKPLGVCECCGLHWHADCVPDPQWQTQLPNHWTCPLHAEKAAPLPRRPRKPAVIDVALRRQVPNDGVIDIESDSSDSDDDEEEIVKTIPFLPINDVAADYVSAPMSVKKRSERAVYRLKEKSIKLDFIDSISQLRADPWRPNISSDLVVELDSLARRPTADKEAVDNLMELKLQGPVVDSATAEINLGKLIDAALNDEFEQAQILAIKRLMQLKGREKLLRILNEH